jgi:hypothetical protein
VEHRKNQLYQARTDRWLDMLGEICNAYWPQWKILPTLKLKSKLKESATLKKIHHTLEKILANLLYKLHLCKKKFSSFAVKNKIQQQVRLGKKTLYSIRQKIQQIILTIQLLLHI